MKTRILGNKLEVSVLGLGCMGMNFSYAPFPEKKDMIAMIRSALEKGLTFFDTAEDLGKIQTALENIKVIGDRYPEVMEKSTGL